MHRVSLSAWKTRPENARLVAGTLGLLAILAMELASAGQVVPFGIPASSALGLALMAIGSLRARHARAASGRAGQTVHYTSPGALQVPAYMGTTQTVTPRRQSM